MRHSVYTIQPPDHMQRGNFSNYYAKKTFSQYKQTVYFKFRLTLQTTTTNEQQSANKNYNQWLRTALTRSKQPPNARQNTRGPARSVSCMIAASGCFNGCRTDSVLNRNTTAGL